MSPYFVRIDSNVSIANDSDRLQFTNAKNTTNQIQEIFEPFRVLPRHCCSSERFALFLFDGFGFDGLNVSVTSFASASFTFEKARISSSDSGASPLNTVPLYSTEVSLNC